MSSYTPYTQYSDTEFFSEDFVKYLNFRAIICKSCEHYKHGQCEEDDDMYPTVKECPYHELYLTIEDTAGLLENKIWYISRLPARDALKKYAEI